MPVLMHQLAQGPCVAFRGKPPGCRSPDAGVPPDRGPTPALAELFRRVCVPPGGEHAQPRALLAEVSIVPFDAAAETYDP